MISIFKPLYVIVQLYLLQIYFRGIEASVIDYLRPKVVGEPIAKLGMVLVYFLSAFTLGGLCYFNYTDVGIINAIKMFWKL